MRTQFDFSLLSLFTSRVNSAIQYHRLRAIALATLVLAVSFFPAMSRAQTPDPALNALVKKGILTPDEARSAFAETGTTNTYNQAPALIVLVKKGILTTKEAQDA